MDATRGGLADGIERSAQGFVDAVIVVRCCAGFHAGPRYQVMHLRLMLQHQQGNKIAVFS